MQSIVADTTPLNYLVLIQAAEILPNLYRTVLIPPAVKAELAHANTPAIVRAWISQPPQWLEVVSLKQPVDSALAHLDAGEREAISLASELQAILLLMDERDGVTIARDRGLKVVGTLAPTIAGRVDKARSGYNKGTIRSDIRYLEVSKDVRRHRLISISYITTLPRHGRGREFESRRPRHSFQALAESMAFRRGNKKEH